MNLLRGIVRMFLFFLLCIAAIVRIVVWRQFVSSERRRHVIKVSFRAWAMSAVNLLGIRIDFQGEFPEIGTMILPNHRSYIDVVAFPLNTELTFVAKIEVRPWPIIGWGARAADTVWVDRSDKASRRRTRLEMASRLAEGRSAIIFTEGTTFKAPEMGELRPGMFYMAAEGDLPVVPVAIEYKNPDDAWIGKDTFIPHFLRCFGKKHTDMVVRFGPVMTGTDGEELRLRVQTWLQANLEEIRAGLVATDSVNDSVTDDQP